MIYWADSGTDQANYNGRAVFSIININNYVELLNIL